jgi:hypothetical protein
MIDLSTDVNIFSDEKTTFFVGVPLKKSFYENTLSFDSFDYSFCQFISTKRVYTKHVNQKLVEL